MLYPFQSPLTLIKASILYKHFYKIGVIIDDTKFKVTDEMCKAITNMIRRSKENRLGISHHCLTLGSNYKSRNCIVDERRPTEGSSVIIISIRGGNTLRRPH
jgi:hypothetical protein